MKFPGVGDGGRKVKKKCIDQKQGGCTSSKSFGADHGTIRRSTRHRLYTTDAETADEETEDAAADGVNNQDRSPSSEGGMTYWADEGEYNRFTFLPFYE